MTLGGANAGAQSADTYPDKPIRIIVPYVAGGASDLLARTVGKHLQEAFGQPVIVDNRPGASQIIGATAVATAPADGYTLLLSSPTSLVINAYTQKPENLKYNPARDFTSVSLGMTVPLFLVVRPSLPARDVSQFLDLLRSTPKKYTFASIGTGSSTHMAAEMFLQVTDTKMVHVPYKSSMPAVADIVAGNVDASFDVGPSSLPLVEAGKLRVLAVGSVKRFPLLPDLPTIAESINAPGFDVSVWFGLSAPAETPRPVIDKLSKEINRILRLPELREQFLRRGAVLSPTTPEEFEAFIKTERSKWSEVLRTAGIGKE